MDRCRDAIGDSPWLPRLARLGRIMQWTGVAAVVVFFIASAVGASPVTTGSAPTVLVGANGAGFNGAVTQYDGAAVDWRHTGAKSYHSVERVGDGRVFTTMIKESEQCGRFDRPCDRTGVQLLNVSDEDPRVEWSWTFPVATTLNSEVHDADRLPNGNLVVADMDRERILIVEYPSGEVIWQWNASQHYHAPADPLRRDWLHINDVDPIGDGGDRFLVSVRNANQLLIVERGEGVVETINADRSDANDEQCLYHGQLAPDPQGDVRCGDADTLNHQHNPQWLSNGTVLVADSENDRVVELHRSNGSWTVGWELHSAGQIPFDWPRDADRRPNGHTVITDSRNNRVVAVDASGDLVWSIGTKSLPYEADVGTEYPAGSAYDSDAAVGTVRASPPRFAELLHAGARATVPLPHWLSSWHVVVVLAGVLVTLYGTIMRDVATLLRTDADAVTDDATASRGPDRG